MTNEAIPPAIVIKEPVIKNGVISEFMLGISPDTKQLTSWLIINFGLYKQGLGGLDLSKDNKAALFLTSVLGIVGVGDTAALVGKAVRVEHDDKKIYALGSYMEDGKWFHLETGIISDVPPSKLQKTSSQPGEDLLKVVTNTDADGKKHHIGHSDSVTVGADIPD